MENVVLLDEAGNASGTADKMAVHHTRTPLHLAFSCYMFDGSGQFLLTRRAESKRTFPGLWADTCSGHPLPGEPMSGAVLRRLRQDLGISSAGLMLVLPQFRYQARMTNGVLENELCPVYAAYTDALPSPDPAEVAEVRWVEWEEFCVAVQSGRQIVAPWCALQLDELIALGPQPLEWIAADAAELPRAALATQAMSIGNLAISTGPTDRVRGYDFLDRQMRGSGLDSGLPRSTGPSGPSEDTAVSRPDTDPRSPIGRGLGGDLADRGSRGSEKLPITRRYLRCEYPEIIPAGKPFSLLASIVLAGSASAILKPFAVPPQGRQVLLVIHAPELRLLSDQRQTVHVPTDRNSERVMFEFRADRPGPRQISITAWIDGSYLGEVIAEVTAESDHPASPHRDVLAEITTEPVEGAVSLVVRYDPAKNLYRFEFRDEDNPCEVTSALAYEPGPRVEQLVSSLDELAKGRTGYSAGQARDYLVNAGAGLWRELVPQALREQFWDRQQRIRQLTILADKDVVPWELLYPRDTSRDAGFLVEQFPVTRAIFGHRPARRIRLWPARFVLPENSSSEARAEIDALRCLLDPEQAPAAVISALTPLQDLIHSGDFGLLHFACHNTFNQADGSSITLDNVHFTPTHLTTAAIDKVLDRSAPTIFLNACRSVGLSVTYNRLDGWASKFLEAGAGVFIGSLWAVCDGTAREFAQEFYAQFRTGSSLGEAVKHARQVAATQADDPTWLAYTVYGDPNATVDLRA